jgi:hypothetical protein
MRFYTNDDYKSWLKSLLDGFRDGLKYAEEVGAAEWEEASENRFNELQGIEGYPSPRHLLTYKHGFLTGILTLWRHLEDEEEREQGQGSKTPAAPASRPQRPRQPRLFE